MDVVARIGTFSPGTGPSSREVRLLVSGELNVEGSEIGTLYGVGSLLKRMSRWIRKMTSFVGSSGIVSSASMTDSVVRSMKDCQSLTARLYSSSLAARSARFVVVIRVLTLQPRSSVVGL